MRSGLVKRPVTRPLGRALGALGTRWAAGWRRLPRWVRLPVRLGLLTALGVTLVAAVPYGWTQSAAAGHLYAESQLSPAGGPRADVLLVLGSQVAPGGTEPMPFLKGRLDTAASLARSGYAKVVLVSGDAGGGSGDETAVMASYLVRSGVDPGRIVTDPYGLDTYDSCVRANRVYGVTRALVVTQPYHLARAVALCRHAGIDADGVGARCDGCGLNVVRNALRDYLACTKVAVDVLRDRDPVVVSPPSRAVADALART
jgi:vancomycin permeability regulator SanA